MAGAVRPFLPSLTVWQPWASLIAEEAKQHEFRNWPAPRHVRNQRIAIHAGARPVRRDEIRDLLLRLSGADAWTTALGRTIAVPLLERGLSAPGLLPLSSVMCTAYLGVPVPAASVVPHGEGDSDRIDHQKWAWPLTDVRRLDVPAPARGAQGFWRWPNLETSATRTGQELKV